MKTRMKTRFFCWVALLVCALPTAAFAQQSQYLAIRLSAVSGDGTACAGDGCFLGDPEARYNLDGVSAHMVWGQRYPLSTVDRSELELSVLRADIETPDAARGSNEKSATMASLMSGTYWDFAYNASVIPYLGIGAGLGYYSGLRGKITHEGRVLAYDKDGFHPAVFIEAGVGLEVDKGLEIVPALRWQTMLDTDYTEEEDTFFVTFSIGTRWRF